MSKISELFNQNKDVIIFLGCGQSINNLTKDQWKIIEKFDTMASNNFHYHSFVPTYYHLEIKARDREIWKRVQHNRLDYNNVKWIINTSKNVADILPAGARTYYYDMVKLGNERVECPNFLLNTNLDNTLTCACGVSVTMFFELWYKMGYKNVILLGMDMHNSKYFWTDRPEYGSTHCHHNKDFEGKDENSPHNTAHIKNFIVDFNKKYMMPLGR